MPADSRRTRFQSERRSWNGKTPPFARRSPICEKSWAAVATSSANTKAATETYEEKKERTEGRERQLLILNSISRAVQLILEWHFLVAFASKKHYDTLFANWHFFPYVQGSVELAGVVLVWNKYLKSVVQSWTAPARGMCTRSTRKHKRISSSTIPPPNLDWGCAIQSLINTHGS